MDIFEKHFDMLHTFHEVFEAHKRNESVGIKISEQEKKDYLKLGKELLSAKEINYFIEVRSVHYRNIVTKRLIEYALPEWWFYQNIYMWRLFHEKVYHGTGPGNDQFPLYFI